MKNKLKKILLFISLILIITTLILAILGSFNRKGYLSEFKLLTSKNGNYTYSFRIKYYSQFFRNSDIYKVYFNVPKSVNINNNKIELKNIKINENGSPFGSFICSKELKYDDKIENINYKLKLKFIFYIIFVTTCMYSIYTLFINEYLQIFVTKNKILLNKLYNIAAIFIIFIIILLFILGKLEHKTNLEDLELINHTKAGYIYKATLSNNGLFSDNFIYKYSNTPLKFINKPDYIKNYGYNLELYRAPWVQKTLAKAWNNEDGFSISNSVNWHTAYGYDINPSIGEKYLISINVKKVSGGCGNIYVHLDEYNRNIPINGTDKIDYNYKLYTQLIDIKNVGRMDYPSLMFYFPVGVYDIKFIKVEQINDKLYVKDNKYIIFTSDKDIKDINSEIVYKLDINNYLIIILFILIAIFIYKLKLIPYTKKLLINNKYIILKYTAITLSFFILLILILHFLGRNIDRDGYISDFQLNKSQSYSNNYTFNFKVKYNSKIFRNSDIYEVYPYLNNLPNYIKNIKMNDNMGTPFGTLISTKELKFNDKINIKYYLMIKSNITYYIFILFLIISIITIFYIIYKYIKYKKTLDNNDYYFVTIIELITIILFLFQYWLFYPGYFENFDTWRSIIKGLYNLSNNWDPVLVDISFKFIDKLGLNTSVLYFINLALWYAAIFLLVFSLYLKFKNKNIVLIFLFSFIYEIYFSNVEYLKDNTSTLYFIFACSIIFTTIILNISYKTKKLLLIIANILLIIALLHRHNFIVTVYPIFFYIVYYYMKQLNINNKKKYIIYYFSSLIIIAASLIAIYVIFPKIFVKNMDTGSTYHILYLQIAGSAVRSNDDTLIPEYWYGDGKNFNDVIEQYNSNPIYGDPFWNKNILVPSKSHDIKKVWIKSILKHPISYMKHIINYTKNMWTIEYYRDKVYGTYANYRSIKTFNIEDFNNTKFYRENKGINFSDLKNDIYIFFYKHLPKINVSIYVLLSIFLFCIIGLLLLKPKLRNDLLIFSFSISFSSLATSIIIAIFTPSAMFQYRYMYPVVPTTIIALISFMTFIYDIGGLKKIIYNKNKYKIITKKQ